MNRANDNCDRLFSFFLGELPIEEKRAFVSHLPGCPACRKELKQLNQVWDTLPYSMAEMEPPSQLKSEVLGTIFQENPVRDASSAPEPMPALVPRIIPGNTSRRSNRRFWPYAAAAVMIVLLGFVGWTEVTERLDRASGQSDLHIPAQLVEQYSLKSFDPTIPAAVGQAWLMKKGDSMELMLQMSGLPSLQGNQAYQVWLVKNGSRHNSGTFRVDANGNGVLTYVIDKDNLAFDTIGITLEPDSEGTQPRGKKVLGT
ncbi:anti-sigma factor [Paenibacillus sp. UNC451MF]|uniref:anti-sigma factor n=1 Tax=Paenibacillus sp. UNC451MF TaxID=1449063 RepID=UPI00048D4FAA|nr:anti-sigma factor [Paenibacillus sp. UNC451MF]